MVAKHVIVLAAAASLLAVDAPLAGNSHKDTASHRSPYSGEETRRIKSLSQEDIDDLRNGRGWGLAKAAELNGMPGPMHLLEMRERIDLSSEQVARIETLFNEMRTKAKALGEQLIALEKELNDAFATGAIDEAILSAKLDAIGDVRTRLRRAHLETHLATPKILTPAQIAAYNRLRGYSAADSCAAVPDGHNPEMWRKHNGC